MKTQNSQIVLQVYGNLQVTNPFIIENNQKN